MAFLGRTSIAEPNWQALHYANYWDCFHGFVVFPAGTRLLSLAVEEHFYLLFRVVRGLAAAGHSRTVESGRAGSGSAS